MKKHAFTKNVEKMIDPIEAGTIHYLQSYIKSIPVKIQDKIMRSGSKKNPYMGLVVEPYSFFLCYEIIDLDWAQRLIPDHYKLVQTAIFDDDTPKYYCILGSFNARTSAFFGTRMEFYIIAENTKTGLLSWIIVDYDTNTVGFNPKDGLKASNTTHAILTTNYDGDVIIDIENKQQNRALVVDGNITNKAMKPLCQRLWLEGNLSVTYGRELSKNTGEAFAVIFNPKEVESGLLIPEDAISIEKNTWYPGLFAQTPSQIVCIPYAQHFLSDSPGHFSTIENEAQLITHFMQTDFTRFPKYSSESLKKAMLCGQFISLITIIILVIALILK